MPIDGDNEVSPGLAEVLEATSALDHAGHLDEQVPILRAAIQRFPDETELHLRLVLVAWDLEHLKSVSDLLTAEGDPQRLTRAAALAVAFSDFKTARCFFDHAFANVTDDFAHFPHLCYVAGRIAAAEGNVAGAEALLRKSFETEPATGDAGYYLACLLFEEGRLREAVAVVEEALDHRAGDTWLLSLKKEHARHFGAPAPEPRVGRRRNRRTDH